MVQLIQNCWHGIIAWSQQSRGEPSEMEYRVGRYRAEYTVPTEAEIAAEDPELTELYKRSKRISR